MGLKEFQLELKGRTHPPLRAANALSHQPFFTFSMNWVMR
jgi:hypothetical protein